MPVPLPIKYVLFSRMWFLILMGIIFWVWTFAILRGPTPEAMVAHQKALERRINPPMVFLEEEDLYEDKEGEEDMKGDPLPSPSYSPTWQGIPYNSLNMRQLLATASTQDSMLGRLSEPLPRDLAALEAKKRVEDNEILEVHPRTWVLPTEYLLFMHIPKTAGFTFINLLVDNIFKEAKKQEMGKPEEERSRHCRTYCPCPEGYTIWGVWFPQDDLCRLHYGHVDYSSLVYMQRESGEVVHSVTWIRHPVKRLISEYNYLQNVLLDHPIRNITIEDYVGDYIPKSGLDNLMVRMMAGVGTAKYSKKLYSQEVFDYIRSNRTLMLALAKRNLLHLTYFGVLEHFDDSVDLLLYTFNMTHLRNLSYASDHIIRPGDKAIVTQELEDKIAKMEDLDLQLYDWARSIFQGRMRYLRRQEELARAKKQ